MTKQRETIKQIISLSTKHLTAEEIFFAAKKIMPKIAFGTVYRNLGILVEDGEIKKVVTIDNVIHYDKTVTPHEHMICVKCGGVDDVLDFSIGKEIESIRKKYNIVGYELIIKHICDKCQ